MQVIGLAPNQITLKVSEDEGALIVDALLTLSRDIGYLASQPDAADVRLTLDQMADGLAHAVEAYDLPMRARLAPLPPHIT